MVKKIIRALLTIISVYYSQQLMYYAIRVITYKLLQVSNNTSFYDYSLCFRCNYRRNYIIFIISLIINKVGNPHLLWKEP